MSKKLTGENSHKEESLFKEYQEAYYKDGDLALALDKLEELLELTNIKQFVSYLIVDIYILKWVNPLKRRMKSQIEVFNISILFLDYTNSMLN